MRELDRPARPAHLMVVEPAKAPRLGKGGSLESRISLLHALAHAECWAIDLACDIICRFGCRRGHAVGDPAAEALPDQFCVDFLTVAADEARHFGLLEKRLIALGSSYGALPVHDGLWSSAFDTRGSLQERLVIEHCVHEARGLDTLPQTVARFRSGGDEESAQLLEGQILPDEVSHCAAGLRWFKWTLDDESQAVDAFHAIVRRRFRGVLKPPFNREARSSAGLAEEYYIPLTTKA